MAHDTWIREYCPKCKSGNWINCGDLDDCSGRDIDSLCCYNCLHVYWLLDKYELKDILQNECEEYEEYEKQGLSETEICNKLLHEVANIEVGRKNPDDEYVSYYYILEHLAKEKENEEQQTN